jgi:lipoprotein-releasing system ATP-binding protein
MDTEYQGDLFINGELMRNKKESELAIVRNEYIGFVFQFHYLLNEFNVLENVMLPGLKLNKYSKEEVEHRAMEKLKMLGIASEAFKKTSQLSGGQKQRVSIARALIKDPEILLLDDCLSAVDTETEEIILSNLKEYCKNKTTIIVSNRVSSAKNADNIIIIEAGSIIQQGPHYQLVNEEGYYKELYLKQLSEKDLK